jgi:4-amino-4-deoxy-L-arabinose transferase-like glycosyltransferase
MNAASASTAPTAATTTAGTAAAATAGTAATTATAGTAATAGSPASPVRSRSGAALHGRSAPRARRRGSLHAPALCLLLAGSLGLRLWGIAEGLPWAYNSDEAQHFVPIAVAFSSRSPNPHYFLNPPAYTYLLHVVFELWFGGPDAVVRAYVLHPGSVFLLARVVSATLGTVAVWLTYLAGRRLFDRTVALLGAAIFGLAFLPVFYSHLALNDVPTLAAVALSLWGVAGVLREGRARDYRVAGLAGGLATATKYTAVIVFMCLAFAFLADAVRRWRSVPAQRWLAPRRMLVALLLGLGMFVLANPYSVLDFHAFIAGVSKQASAAGGEDPTKLGISPGGGIGYYIWTLGWGLGLVPAVAAAGGALALVARRRWWPALVLLPASITFVIFMGVQQRYFGRWEMPIFPILALLGAYAALELVRWLHRSRGIPLPLAGTLAAVLLLSQSLSADVHDDRVLSRPDTRTLTRSWMLAHVAPGSKIVLEPVVPPAWSGRIGAALPYTSDGRQWNLYPTELDRYDARGRPLPAGERHYEPLDQYERTLQPSLLSTYEQQGYCWVVVGSLQADRPFVSPRAAPGAIAYYGALARQARLVYHVSPFAPGAHPVPFGFDWTIDYYPRQYRLPGPEMWVYRLTGGRCALSAASAGA